MGVKVKIHWAHRNYTGGLDVVEVEGKTVGDCIDDLVRKFPEIKKGLYDKSGQFISYIQVYINMKKADPDVRGKAVKEGDVIDLKFILAGG